MQTVNEFGRNFFEIQNNKLLYRENSKGWLGKN